MNKQSILDAVATAKALGIPLRDETQNALAELENPHYTITMSGEFQVGKSTLLNRVMIGSDVLLTEGEGKGLATTAIPTKVVYAPTKELTVVFHDESRAPERHFGDDVTPDLLRSLTTANGTEARLALAKEIRHVVLGMPVEALRTYTFFDTPGVNDPDTELIERTTAETLPLSDIVLLVVDASRQLSHENLAYLKRAVFTAGMTRAMVLASYNPITYKTPEARAAILSTIRAQLAGIGRDYVPVVSYTYDMEEEGDILRGPQEILGAVLKFLAENCEGAKVDKLAWCLSQDAIAHAESLKAQIEVSGKSESEIEELKRRIEAAARSLDAEYNQSKNDFSAEFARIQSDANVRLREALLSESDDNSAIKQFEKQFNGLSSLDEIKNAVEPAVKTVAPIVQAKQAEVATAFVAELRMVLQRTSEQADKAAGGISLSPDFAPIVSGGWAGRLNPTLVKVIETGVALLTLGPVFAAITYFLDKIPVLKSFAPDVLLAGMVKKNLFSSFKNELSIAHQGFLGQMENAQNCVIDGIKEVFAAIYRERIVPYEKAIEESAGKVMPAEAVEAARKRIADIEKFAATAAG